jgi:hypothetical protein
MSSHGNMSLTAERLRELLEYDPQTGVFVWRLTSGKRKAGRIAGAVERLGYIRIGVDRKLYRSSRLAWLYMTGSWPANCIDHIDRDPGNNRWGNLREATLSQNQANSVRRNRLGFKGVSHDPRWGKPRYYASIISGGRDLHIGAFDTPEEAHAAYLAKAREIHGEYARGK